MHSQSVTLYLFFYCIGKKTLYKELQKDPEEYADLVNVASDNKAQATCSIWTFVAML